MSVGAAGGATSPQLQTSWTRAEAACAARHRGDTYYELTHPAPKPDAPPDASPTTKALAPGFTLHI